MGIQSLIDIYRMTEISVDTRIKLIKKMGLAIDNTMELSITGPVVAELILLLNPEYELGDI